MIQILNTWYNPEDIGKITVDAVLRDCGTKKQWFIEVEIKGSSESVLEYFSSKSQCYARCEYISDQKKFIYAIRK